MNGLLELRKELRKIADPQKAKILQRFFKTGIGEYGEGDIFLGITVPNSRKIAIKFKDLPFSEISKLLKSKIHEERLIALLVLVYNFSHFAKASRDKQKQIFDFYLSNTEYINNWDLVDLSADKIVGAYLLDRGPVGGAEVACENFLVRSSQMNILKEFKMRYFENFVSSPRHILIKLARSKNLWERRISILATYYFIKNGKFRETLKIAEILLQDKHDLIQKAVGWMLREVGKRDLKTEVGFLNKHYKKMPRTMLRYAIEKFPQKLRVSYLKRN